MKKYNHRFNNDIMFSRFCNFFILLKYLLITIVLSAHISIFELDLIKIESTKLFEFIKY